MLTGIKYIAGPRYIITVILIMLTTVSGLLLKTGMEHEYLTLFTSFPFVFIAFLIIALMWFYRLILRIPWGLIPLVLVLVGAFFFSQLWVM